MPVWCVTGKLGAGKSLVAVGKIKEYLKQGRRVATNIDLNLEYLLPHGNSNACVYRLPDVPTVDDLKSIGMGYDGKFKGDDKNGIIVLDECAIWLNSRSWNDPKRKPFNKHFVHLRKLRWDLCLLIQDFESLDSQFRNNYCEYIVYCRRTDRLKSFGLKLPRVHVGAVYLNTGMGQKPPIENWIYRGNDLMPAYNTEQPFDEDSPIKLNRLLPPKLLGQKKTSRFLRLKTAFDLQTSLLTLFVVSLFIFSIFKIFEKTVVAEEVTEAVTDDTLAVSSVTDSEPEENIVVTGYVNSSHGIEFLFSNSDGEPFYLSENGYRLVGGHGQPHRFDCKAVLQDVKTKEIINVLCE